MLAVGVLPVGTPAGSWVFRGQAKEGKGNMRVRSRVAVIATAAIFGLPGAAYASDPPVGPVTAQTVAASQADATAAATASTARLPRRAAPAGAGAGRRKQRDRRRAGRRRRGRREPDARERGRRCRILR